jgi:ParB family chromosome partitioning protein
MSKLPILVRARDCEKSPSNVRKSSDPVADLQFRANVAARGIIQNLIGVPVPRKRRQYRIVAGGRRLDAVLSLIEDGTFPADYCIPLLVLGDSKDAIEISLSENFFKLDMNPADACRAFQDIIALERKTPVDVAKRFGLTERFVLGRLRLASLAEPVFEALRVGNITLDVAMAYASTSDTERQSNIFGELAGSYYADNANEIRRRLTIGDHLGSDPKALLVGREAYDAAGGQVDCDLFSTSQTERWTSGDILERLAKDRLQEAAAALVASEGFAEVRAIPATRVPYMETLRLTAVEGEPVALSPAEEKRQREIEAELETINDNCDVDGYTEEEHARVRALEAEYARIEEQPPLILDEHKASAIAYLVIGVDGVPRLHDQLYTCPVVENADECGVEADIVDDDEVQASEELTPDRPAISQRLRDELAMMKTEILKVHVATDTYFALDLGIFFMVEAATQKYGSYDLPSDLRANAPSPRVYGFESGTPAAEHWASIDAGLDRSWTEAKTVAERYDAYCALSEEARGAWLGWAVARTLHAVPAGDRGTDMIDHLGRKLEIDMAAWWRPTARTYFDRVSKPRILDLFEEIGGLELKSRYGASKKYDLATSAERLFSGQIIIEADLKEKALAWLPDEMRLSLDVPLSLDDADVGVAESEGLASDAAKDLKSDITQAA